MEKLREKIAGEITLSDAPGKTMKKWREMLDISQSEMSAYLGISPSTMSDYESNRRKSPGCVVIRRFVDGALSIEEKRGNKRIQELFPFDEKKEEFYEVHEFAAGMSAIDLMKLVNGKVVANEDILESKKLYGYTIIDSIRVILDMPLSQFPKLYGTMSERAFIFTKVTTGRSPMVVIRVTHLKPSVVVLHKLDEIDELAKKIAEKEQIPVITTKMDIEKIKEELNKM
jgi:putative transcriptional regulator